MPPIEHRGSVGSGRRSLDEILDTPDEFGMLEVEAKRGSAQGQSVETAKFEEINDFVDREGRTPDLVGPFDEKLLARRLHSLKANAGLHDGLRSIDRHGLLASTIPVSEQEGAEVDQERSQTAQSINVSASENVTSLDDIFASGEFDQFADGDESLFDMVHVPAVIVDRDKPDEIAQRRVCEDFYQFESLFHATHERLKNGEAKAIRFQKASQVREGDMFILQGVVCLVDEVGKERQDNFGNYDPRLRVIFENGSESNLLLRSLGKALYQDETGRRILADANSVVDDFNNISHKDKRAGQIYLVTTRNTNPQLAAVPNLIKIGYTEQTVEYRTRNAERDKAFLESPVKILATVECYNLNPHKFETLIHGFLHAQRLKMTLTDKAGKPYRPKEWFSVSLETALETVHLIVSGEIIQYRMDNTTGRLVKKK